MTKILIVDDERQVVQQIRHLLSGFGYSSDFVTKAALLFSKLEREPFDLILLDVNMPDTDGMTLLQHLKTESRYNMIPVIMVTAVLDDKLMAHCFENGATDFINKPVNTLILKARLQAALITKTHIQQIQQQKETLEEQTVQLNHSNKRLQQEIRDRQQAEIALQNTHDGLEKRVQKRTHELSQSNTALQQEVIERKRIEEQLKAWLREKEVLLKEIHHRVKNNLQIISGLLDLQADYLEDDLVQLAFLESRNRIQAMALIHESLYQSETLAEIDFADYVDELVTHLRQSYNTTKIRLKINIASISLTLEQAIPCGLIINELITNAFKHAFPPDTHGQIWVELLVEETQAPPGQLQLTLLVRDNGLGFPPDVDFQKTESLGLTLVLTLVKQLKGTIKLQSQHGTEFEIIFVDPM